MRSRILVVGRRAEEEEGRKKKKEEGQNLEKAFRGDTSRGTSTVGGPKCSFEGSQGGCPGVAWG